MVKSQVSCRRPVALDMAPGTSHYCTCGLSRNQPFGDGNHRGTDFLPQEFVVDEQQRLALCQCKYTKEAPHCDGAHKFIQEGDDS